MQARPLREYCVGSGSYGIPAAAEDFDPKKHRYLRITDISDDGRLLSDSPKSLSHKDAEHYLLSPGDIVFARTGNSTGRTYYFEAEDGPLVYAGFLIKFKINARLINPRYLKYYTLSQQYRKWISDYSGGSTRGNLSAEDYAGMPVYAPARERQDALVGLLDRVTSKITLNHRINAELLAMAKLLYDYWFVQFDFPISEELATRMGNPKLKGKPYKSSGGPMAYNVELKREVPAGWEAGTLSDLGEIVGGSTPSTANAELFTKSGTPWITPKDLSNNYGNRYITRGEVDVSDLGIASTSLKVMPAGTVLLSSRAPIGYMAIARQAVTTNQGFKSFVPNKGYSTEYIFETVRLYMPGIIGQSAGTTFKEVSKANLSAVKICLPPKGIVDDFTKVAAPIFELEDVLETENHELATLRDWLLPMLMNGQVRVGES